MKNTIKSFVFAVFALGATALDAATTGSCMANAAVLTPASSFRTVNVTVTKEYDEWDNTYSDYSYVYYYKVTLQRGSTYTFNVKYSNEMMFSVGFYSDTMLQPSWDSGDSSAGDAFDEQFTILGSSWDDVEETSAVCYIIFYGDKEGSVLGKGVLSYKTGVDIPAGTTENPAVLTVGTGFATLTGNLTERHAGQYLCKATLSAGRKYRFLTTSGTEALPADMTIMPSAVSDVEIATNDFYNVGYDITPAEDGVYVIQLSTDAASVGLQYGAYPVRAIGSHTAAGLAAGRRTEFQAGHMNAEGSDYFDTIIDESLFTFSPTSGRRYRIETDSAAVPLRMELYDDSGNVIASNKCVSASDRNVRVSFQANSNSAMYVGVCQDVTDDTEIYAARVGITLTDVTDLTDGRDAVAAATPISPAISSVADYPVNLDPVGSGPYSLSATEWRNTYAVAARAGWTYMFFADDIERTTIGTKLVGSVFTKDGSYETPVAADGAITASDITGLSFTAAENATYYVRVQTADNEGFITEGLDYGSYTLHAAAVAPAGVSGYSVLSVNAMGPAKDDGATWRISSGTSGNEPDYPFGTTVPVTANASSFTVYYGYVNGFTLSQSYASVQYAAGTTNVLTAVYSDTYDTGDDTMPGANSLNFGETAQTLTRTLWTGDGADWFRFSATAGRFYNMSFLESTGAPFMTVVDESGNELLSGASSLRFGATEDGTFYLKVGHADNGARVNSSYKLSYFYADVGYVSFSNGGAFTAEKGSAYAEVTVERSSSGGALRLDYGTVSGTAKAGEDYSPVSGTLSWGDGDKSARTIRIPLIPDIRPENEGGETFSVKIAAKADAVLADGEYPAIVAGSPVATVTIADTVDAAPGTISITAYGTAKAALAGASVSVHPGDTVPFWVAREGGSNGVAKVAVYVDGELDGVLTWQSGESGEKMFAIGSPSDSPARTIAVKLEAVSGAASFARSGVNVVVTSSAPAISYPGDDGELRLASGSFFGVLSRDDADQNEDGGFSLASFELHEASGRITAKVDTGAFDKTFDGLSFDALPAGDDGSERTITATTVYQVNGESYEGSLRVRLSNAPFSSLNSGFSAGDGFNWAEVRLFVPAADGVSAKELSWSGEIYRDNRDVPDNAVAASLFKGRYTAALVSAEQPFDDEPKGNGFMTFAIDGDGQVTGYAVMPDGGAQHELSGLAYFNGSYDEPDEMTAVLPIFYGSGNELFGGELHIALKDGVAVVATAGYEPLFWHSGSAELPIARGLIPVGGLFDPSLNVEAMLFGKSAFATTDGYDVYFADSIDNLALSVDMSTGAVGASVPLAGGSAQFSGVIMQNADTVDSLSLDGIFASGLLSSGGDTYPFSIYVDDTDGDYSEDYGLTSTITFNGNGNTSGSAPEPLVANVGTVEFIPPLNDNFRRNGYEFLGWTDGAGVWQPGDEIVMPVSDKSLTARWTISVKGVAEAFDCPAQAFLGDGAAGWYPQANEFVQGVDGNTRAIRSGAVGDSEETYIETTVEGSGQLSFWYKVSSENNYDKLIVAIDGVTVAEYSGEVVWTRFVTEIASPGTHTIRWTYRKDSMSSGGQDAAWLDLFSFGPTVTVTFDPKGGDMAETSLKYVVGEKYGSLPEPDYGALASFGGWTDSLGAAVTAASIVPGVDHILYATVMEKAWKVQFAAGGASGTPPKALSGVVNSTVVLPGVGSLVKAGYEFGGWTDGSAVYKAGDAYTIATRADAMLTAMWTLAGLDTVLGPGAATFSFDLEGDVDWYAADDGASMRSGRTTDAQTSVLKATAQSFGTLSFDLATSCDEVSYAWCAFAVNGEEKFRIGGVTDWTTVELDVESGDVLTWTFAKRAGAYSYPDTRAGEDCSWVKNFRFGKKTTVTFVAAGGTPASTNVVAFAGEPIGVLPYPTWTNYSLDYWKAPDGSVVTESWIVPDGGVTLTAVKKAKEWRVVYNLDGGKAVTVVNGSYAAGSKFNLPGEDSAEKDGYALDGWSDGTATYAPGAERTVAGGADLSFTAVWRADFASALDCRGSGLSFASGGDAEWAVQTDKTSSGGAAMQSGVIGGTGRMAEEDCQSWVEATVTGEGTLSFDWAVSCDDGDSSRQYAWLECTLDGETAAEPIYGTGNTSWRTITLELGEGEHVIRWAYVKERNAYNESSGYVGDDRAWLDNLVWTPAVPPGVDFAMEYDDALFASGVTVSNDTAKAAVEVAGKTFKALPGDVLVFELSAAGAMPVYSATFGGAGLNKLSYGVYSYTVGESGGTFSFGATAASDQPGDLASQEAAKEAIVSSVAAPAAGKTLEETRAMVSGQVDAILGSGLGANASDVAAWIDEGGFTGAEIATASSIDVSFGLGADSLFASDPVAEIEEAALSADRRTYSLTFRLTDGPSGAAAKAAATAQAKAYVESLVQVTTDLGDWSRKPAGSLVAADYDAATDEIKVNVSLPAGLDRVFLKVVK